MNVTVFQITRAATSDTREVSVAQGRGQGGAPDDALEVVEPPGLRARPVVRSSTEALVVELPNGDRFAFLLDKEAREGAVALEAGETQLRGCAVPAAVVRIRASGDVEITPAEGCSVILAGGTERVARREGAVRAAGTTAPPSGMAGWIASVTAALNTLGVTVNPPTNFGVIDDGAEHVLA